MQANAQAKLVHDLKALRSTRSHTWLLLKYTQNSVGLENLPSFFSFKFILVTKKGIYRNDKFDSLFSLCTTARF